MEDGSLSELAFLLSFSKIYLDDILAFAFILLCLLLLLFALVAVALSKASRTRFLRAIKANSPTSEYLLKKYDTVLSLTRIGILAIFAGMLYITFYWFSPDFPESIFLSFFFSVLVVFGIFVFSINVVAEFFARKDSETVIRLFFPLTSKLALFFYPILWLAGFLRKVFARILGTRTQENIGEIIGQEILDAVNYARIMGLISAESEKMIKQVLDLRETTASDIMTPRTEMVSISCEESLIEALKLAHNHGHSRIPVYESTRDNIVGILYTRDLLPKLAEGENLNNVELDSIIRKPPTIIPETKNVVLLLNQMRSQKISMAVVVDEYGGTAGVVTLEDILEEIVGEIRDEYDEAEEIFDVVPIDKEKGIFEADARCRIDSVNETLNINLPENEDFDTLGGYLSFVCGRVPETGKQIEDEFFTYLVLEADERRIKKIRMLAKSQREDTSSRHKTPES